MNLTVLSFTVGKLLLLFTHLSNLEMWITVLILFIEDYNTICLKQCFIALGD